MGLSPEIEARLEHADRGLVLPVLCLVCCVILLFQFLRHLPSTIRTGRDILAARAAMDEELIRIELPRPCGEALCFELVQDFDDTFKRTGGALWQGAVALAMELLLADSSPPPALGQQGGTSATPVLRGKTVIELGCGIGLVSLACAAALEPAIMLATDGDKRALQLVRLNAVANLHQATAQDRLTLQRLRWSASSAAATRRRHNGGTAFDVVLASDVIYWPSPLDALLETILTLSGAETIVVIAHRDRDRSAKQAADFFSELSTHFEKVDKSVIGDGIGKAMHGDSAGHSSARNSPQPATGVPVSGGDLGERGPRFLYVFQHLRDSSASIFATEATHACNQRADGDVAHSTDDESADHSNFSEQEEDMVDKQDGSESACEFRSRTTRPVVD